MNVLVILEDFVKDQFIAKPLVAKMLEQLGKPNANVRVCTNPRLRGVDQALDWKRLAPILDRYRGMVRLFLLIVDRDGDEYRQAKLDYLETNSAAALTADRFLLAEHAWQELEVWAIAGQDLPDGWSWSEIRDHRDSKEAYFLPLAKNRGLLDEPEQGRGVLGLEAAQNYRRVRSRCPEDVQRLEERIAEWLQSTGS